MAAEDLVIAGVFDAQFGKHRLAGVGINQGRCESGELIDEPIVAVHDLVLFQHCAGDNRCTA